MMQAVRRHTTALALVAVVAALTGCNATPADQGTVGTRLGSFTLPGISAGTVDSAAFVGSPLVVTFGASWCAPCKKEYPMLVAAQAAHRELRVLGVLEQDVPNLMVKFMQSVGADWPVGDDGDGSVGDRFGVRGLPVTLFVDSTGKIVGRRAGLADQATLDRELAKIGL